MQKKLETYFKIIPKYNEHNKKCFIYDPDNCRSYFTTKPDPTDKFVVLRSGIKLFYRTPTNRELVEIPIIKCNYGVPLVKSNLQKAIRRCDSEIAIQSALALIQMAPIEFIRRLPIIYIEDVCLIDTYPISVWFMMADKDYGKLTNRDIDTLLKIVNSLCECKIYFPYIANDSLQYAFTPETLQFCPNSDCLMALYFRSEYGGMKGDMQMLRVAIDYYRMHPTEVQRTEFGTINYQLIERDIEILVEAIDFHPYPQMLSMLKKITAIHGDTIKEFIWFAESGYNVRKPDTILSSQQYQERNEWKKIEKNLETVRYELISFIALPNTC